MHAIQVQMGIMEAGDARLYCETAGEGRPLVFIHGYGMDARAWESQFYSFLPQHRVVRYDLRGYGRSSLPTKNAYSHSADLLALLDRLGIEKASLVGQSMGGWIATNFALNYPERTQSLVLVDSALYGYRWSHEWRRLWEAIHEKADVAGARAANQMWLEHPLFAPAREQPAVAARLSAMIAGYSGWHWVLSDVHTPVQPPDIERLEELQAPTLVLTGRRDLPDFQSIAAILSERLPHASRVRLSGVGHLSNMEAPVAFNHALTRFLAEM
jgi:3-oxoadipate enol-lactonase